ncbi:MAG: T9SS type A sorting domain-containing protein [Ignavibacteriae bacterium]|nr:T9SS type A sorting domain-containing protein [Ignavibacteriota bacterium]
MYCQKVQLKKGIIKSLIKFFPFFFIIIICANSFAQNLLSSPECVSFDASRNRYLVSCYQSGNIVQIDSNGVQSYLLTGFGHVMSNVIKGNIFYFSTITSVKGYDISVTPPQQVMNVSIPGSIQLDGMVTDTSGYLYVADFDYSGSNDRIFKINLTTYSWSTFVPSGQGLGSPQDIEYDKENNRLIVANWFNNCPIQAVSLIDSTVTNILPNSIGNFDGVARDTSGNYYFTSWTTNKAYKYDKNFTISPVVVASGLNGPANVSYNPRGNLLIIPNFNTNSLVYIQLNSIGIKKIGNNISGEYKLYQNFPNPFNPKTNIKFDLLKPGKVKLSVFDITGKEITTLVNDYISSGKYEAVFDASDYSSGVYFYRLETDNFSNTKRMILIK